jgi:hypothetical protein
MNTPIISDIFEENFWISITMRNIRSLLLLCLLATLPATAEETKTLVWPDGTRYVGGVEDGKRSGKGTIFWQDGTRFVGTFVDDLRNGPGTMILPDGTVYNGYFENDKLVQQSAASSEPTAPVAAISADDVDSSSLAKNVTDEASSNTAQTTAPAAEPTTTVEETTDTPIAEPEPLPTLTVELRQAVQAAVDQWAAAWSAQDVETYLASYAESFQVPGRQSRRQWEGLRRSRLTRPSRIDVKLIYDTFEVIAADRVQVDFNQIYDSNLYSDRTNKRLVMVRENSTWKIASETSI